MAVVRRKARLPVHDATLIRSVRWDSFRIPLVAGFDTAHGSLPYRAGLLLQITTRAGTTGYGEISPLAWFGAGLQHAAHMLEQNAPVLLGSSTERTGEMVGGDGPVERAVQAGLDIARCDALARARAVRVAEIIGDLWSPTVPVNATVAGASATEAAASAASAVARGFGHIKLKVGMAASVAEEVERIALVREQIGPNIGLRLDANGAWQADQAIAVLRVAARFDLEFVEQPVPAADTAGMVRVRRAVPVPIAADEAVTGVNGARLVLAHDAADILIVKPLVVGGLRPARQIVEMAEAAGKEIIVTTTVDSGIGIAAALQLAATLREPARACGLATAALLASDLLTCPLPLTGGFMEVPEQPGLGVEIDEQALKRFGTNIHGAISL